MTELYFELDFKVEHQKQYVKHLFMVPENTLRIEIEYDYPRLKKQKNQNGIIIKEETIIDLGLYGPSGDFWGWSGSNKKEIFVSQTSSSPGYRCGRIIPGTWTAILGLYKISKHVTVSLHVRFYPQEKRLLKGDLHMHTINSDGSYTVPEVIDFCKKAGLDFIALTDHNNTVQNTHATAASDITIIPGMEYTNYRGHANFYFDDYDIRNFDFSLLSNTFDEMKETFLTVKRQGALISLNHPDCSNCPWEFGYTGFPFDMIEVWNGPMKASEIKAVKRWHNWLCKGKKIAAVGGSDTHRHELARTYGCPTTFVYTNENSIGSIKRALAQGNSFISISPQGPELHIDIDGKSFGDTVTWKKGLNGVLKIRGTQEGDIIKLISDKNKITKINVGFNGIYSIDFPVENVLFYRVELYRKLLGKTMLISLSNPVYID